MTRLNLPPSDSPIQGIGSHAGGWQSSPGAYFLNNSFLQHFPVISPELQLFLCLYLVDVINVPSSPWVRGTSVERIFPEAVERFIPVGTGNMIYRQ